MWEDGKPDFLGKGYSVFYSCGTTQMARIKDQLKEPPS